MDTSFILSCESTIDLPYSYCEARGIPVLFYSYQVDGVSYEDDMGRDPAALPRFYGFLGEGKLPTTAQLNEFQLSPSSMRCCSRATCCISRSAPA